MTRINLGVIPHELCDQMLRGEYHELPRMVSFAWERWLRYGNAGPRPLEPTLGIGHMAYFLPYGAWLTDRFSFLVEEMEHRGFATQFNELKPFPPGSNRYVPEGHSKQFRPLICERINLRLLEMKRTPTWTNRSKPSWVM